MAIDPFVRLTVGGAVRHVPLRPLSVCRIGRGDQNTIVLAEPVASREHAMVHSDGGGSVFLSDSGSRNGTRLNGRPVTAPVQLQDGDVFAIGRQEIEFHDPGQAAAQIMAMPTGGAVVGDATMFMAEQSLITVLVIDIRGFTVLSREIGEERISALMTTIFRRAGELLDATRTWSQKFIGDAVMAVWRHPGAYLLSHELADVLRVVTALEKLFIDVQAQHQLPRPLRFGAAINTGPAAIGNMGSGSSADFTALGDTVNKTFRLESSSKELGRDVLIGEATFNALAPPLPAAVLPQQVQVTLKGYDAAEPVRVLDFAQVPYFTQTVTGEEQPTSTAYVPGGR